MIGLERKTATEGELRRLSVSKAAQRGGVGRLLLATLMDFASSAGYSSIVLSTGSKLCFPVLDFTLV